ncbi:hypothetical protein AAZV13_06G150500 [Glycine max]
MRRRLFEHLAERHARVAAWTLALHVPQRNVAQG